MFDNMKCAKFITKWIL